MDKRQQLNKLVKAQNNNVALARADLDKLWRRLQGLEPEKQRDALLELIPELVSKYGDVAGTAAAEWYEQARAAEIGESDFLATVGEGFPSEAVQDSIRWKAGVLWDDPQQMQRFLNNSIDRWVKYSGRATIMENAGKDPHRVRWALVPQGKTCAFCTMLASRGFAYHKEDSVKSVQHNNCDCWPCPSWDSKKAYIKGYDPDQMEEDYQAAREELKRVKNGKGHYVTAYKTDKGKGKIDSSDSTSEITWMMRRLKPDEYKDGTHTDVRMTNDQSLSYASYKDYRSSLAERFIELNNSNLKMPPETPVEAPENWPDNLPKLTANAWNHTLYGSYDPKRHKYVGAHVSGYNWISGGESFPDNWGESKIREAAIHVLNSAPMSAHGSYVGTFEGHDILVSTGKRKGVTSIHILKERR
ncbi:VG15 protein [Alloscardovia omnicolens]